MLIKEDPWFGGYEFNAKEVVRCTHVFQWKSVWKGYNEGLKKTIVVACKQRIIYICKEKCFHISICKDEEGRTTLASYKSIWSDDGFQGIMPCLWYLSGPIDSFLKLANIIPMLTIFESWWLGHKTCSESLPWRKALLTFNWCICQQLFKASVSITFTVCGFTIGEKVSLKSTPRHWVNVNSLTSIPICHSNTKQ